MTVSQKVRGAVQAVQPFANAIGMNVTAAVRTRRRGFDGWTGAVNTDYDPMDGRHCRATVRRLPGTAQGWPRALQPEAGHLDSESARRRQSCATGHRPGHQHSRCHPTEVLRSARRSHRRRRTCTPAWPATTPVVTRLRTPTFATHPYSTHPYSTAEIGRSKLVCEICGGPRLRIAPSS
jgi:hypothetical protein